MAAEPASAPVPSEAELPPLPPALPRPRPPRLIQPVKLPATSPPPLDGEWAAGDDRLDEPELFPLPTGAGPEDVLVDPDGGLVTGGDDGRIWRWPAGAAPGSAPRLLAQTGGRPLGIELDPRDGSLIVCDAYRGLLRITGDGAVTDLFRDTLVCNNATVARDGTVYFTDSSDRYPLSGWRREMLEQRPRGRLLAWSPATGRAEVVAAGLHFPNGVGLGPDESTVVLAETSTHRLLRVPLGGGEPVVLADLPAYPDNLSNVGDGTYWIAMPSPRVPILERLLPHPHVRRLAAALPAALQPREKKYALVALVDGAGRVLRTLHGPRGAYQMLTGVRQHGDALWFGSLVERAVARVSLG